MVYSFVKYNLEYIASYDKCFFYSTVDGVWSDWGGYGYCTTTCGNGTSTRSRTCNNPTPSAGGKRCKGINTDTQICKANSCPGMYGCNVILQFVLCLVHNNVCVCKVTQHQHCDTVYS